MASLIIILWSGFFLEIWLEQGEKYNAVKTILPRPNHDPLLRVGHLLYTLYAIHSLHSILHCKNCITFDKCCISYMWKDLCQSRSSGQGGSDGLSTNSQWWTVSRVRLQYLCLDEISLSAIKALNRFQLIPIDHVCLKGENQITRFHIKLVL